MRIDQPQVHVKVVSFRPTPGSLRYSMAIHPLAVVDSAAEVHPEAIVGPFCVIRGRVRIDQGVELRNSVSVYGPANIGAGTICFPGAVIGSDPQDLKFKGEDSRTEIGKECRIHEYVTVSKGTESGGMLTAIGDGTLIMAYAHIAHDCVVGTQCVIGNNAQLAGHIKVEDRAIISGMVGIHHFATIGERAFVGGMSSVRFDIPPFLIADGHPAEPRNVNIVGLRRDGVADEDIRRLRDAFKRLYHSRGTRPLSAVVAELGTELRPEEETRPLGRLLAWLDNHLKTAVDGRLLEASRMPAIGKRMMAETGHAEL